MPSCSPVGRKRRRSATRSLACESHWERGTDAAGRAYPPLLGPASRFGSMYWGPRKTPFPPGQALGLTPGPPPVGVASILCSVLSLWLQFALWLGAPVEPVGSSSERHPADRPEAACNPPAPACIDPAGGAFVRPKLQ